MPRRLKSCKVQRRSPAQTSFFERTSDPSLYFAMGLRDRVLWLSLGGCFGPAASAALQASLRTAFFSLRQIVISSALGMKALQSLSTSGVHAMRCSGVPCEGKAGVATADSNAINIHNCAKSARRSSLNLSLSVVARASMQGSIQVCRRARLSQNVRVCSFRPTCSLIASKMGRSIEQK